MDSLRLAQFIGGRENANGAYHLPVDGWDGLSKDERESCAARFKDQQEALERRKSIRSRQLNLRELDARLQELAEEYEGFDVDDSSESEYSDCSTSSSESSSPYQDWDPDEKIRDTEAYWDLLRAGGRPLFPIELLEEGSEGREEYRDMENFWATFSQVDNQLTLFEKQKRRWRDFRRWQNDNRDIMEDDEGGYPLYAENTMLFNKRWLPPIKYQRYLQDLREHPWHMRRGYDSLLQERNRQRYRRRDHERHGFSEYAEGAKIRLALHNYHQPFELSKDPKTQDTLTTWIEYLNYEYWWLNWCERGVGLEKQRHDARWKALNDRFELGPNDNWQSVRTDESVRKREREELRADRDATLAQMADWCADLAEAFAIRVQAAHERYWHIKERNDAIKEYIFETWDYATQTNSIAGQHVLLKWARAQLSLIEDGLRRSQMPAGTEDAASEPIQEETTGEEILLHD